MISKKLFLGGLVLVVSTYFYNFAKPGGIEKESQYQTIGSFQEAEAVLATADKNSLVVLDADFTLIQPNHPACQMANFKQNKDYIHAFFKKLPEEVSSDIFPTFWMTRAPSVLIDLKIPAMIKKLKGQGASVIVLSAIITGSFPEVGDILTWRLSNLNKLGIKLSSFDIKTRIKLTDFSLYRGNYPEFENGVLLTNGKFVTKGQVLEKFLAKIKWQPTTVYFFDDEERNLRSMQEFAKKQNIAFKGFLYKGAKNAKATPISQKDFKKEWEAMKEKSLAFFKPEEKARAKAAIL
jgi:hypothetical protein